MQLFMEHRWHVRKDISLDVQLIQRDVQTLHARVKNLSMGGMFVQTDPARIYEKTLIDILISPLNDEIIGKCIKAYVIHKNEKGAGLMFHSYDSMTFEILSGLCSYRPVSKHETNANYKNIAAR